MLNKETSKVYTQLPMRIEILSTSLIFPSTFPTYTLDFVSEFLQQLDRTEQILRVAVFLIDSETLEIFEDKLLRKRKEIKLLCDNNIDPSTKRFLKILRRRYYNKFSYKIWNRRSSFHTKFIIFDERSVILGSHNLKMRSLRDNFEISLLIEEPTMVNKFIKIFEYIYQY